MIPLLERTAERCGGFDWDDGAFDHAYGELEGSLFGERRAYGALAPLVGLTAGGTIELGAGLRVRPAASGEFQASWPEAGRLLPRDYGREVDRTLLIELERDLDAADPEVPDAPAEIGRAVSALRLATPGAIAAGPVLFERLDWRPYNVRAVPPLAAQVPPGDATRLDPFRGQARGRADPAPRRRPVRRRRARGARALRDRAVREGSHRADELREALVTLLGGEEGSWAAAMRAAALLGETPRDRGELLEALRGLVDGDGPGARAEDAVRRALVETLLSESREGLIAGLDDALLGLRPRPRVTTAARVLAAG